MIIDWKVIGKQFLLVLIVAVIALICLAVGLMVGYSVLGNGKNPLAILSFDKWQAIMKQFTGQ